MNELPMNPDYNASATGYVGTWHCVRGRMRLAGGRLGEHRHRHPPADHPTLLLRHLIVAAVKEFLA